MRKAIGLSLALLFVATTAESKQAHSSQHPATPSAKTKASGSDTASKRHRQRSHRQIAARSKHHRARPAEEEVSTLPPPDQYIGPVKVIGQREVGSAAWYGGYHLGRRTASGDRLDAVHATAAHRSLPLDTLVRVTNLNNGRSVIAKITDRGPVSRNLLIDVSPRAARELDMIRSGIATVSIEPVAPIPRSPQ